MASNSITQLFGEVVEGGFLNLFYINISIWRNEVLLCQLIRRKLFSFKAIDQIYFTGVICVNYKKSSQVHQVTAEILLRTIQSHQYFSRRKNVTRRRHFILHTDDWFCRFGNDSLKFCQIFQNHFIGCSDCQFHLLFFRGGKHFLSYF